MAGCSSGTSARNSGQAPKMKGRFGAPVALSASGALLTSIAFGISYSRPSACLISGSRTASAIARADTPARFTRSRLAP